MTLAAASGFASRETNDPKVFVEGFKPWIPDGRCAVSPPTRAMFRWAMRSFDTSVLTAHAAAPKGRHLRKAEQILSLGEGHSTSMPEIDSLTT